MPRRARSLRQSLGKVSCAAGRGGQNAEWVAAKHGGARGTASGPGLAGNVGGPGVREGMQHLQTRSMRASPRRFSEAVDSALQRARPAGARVSTGAGVRCPRGQQPKRTCGRQSTGEPSRSRWYRFAATLGEACGLVRLNYMERRRAILDRDQDRATRGSQYLGVEVFSIRNFLS